jgi:PTH1 family peptidyl-tRNA hydrolase
MLDRYFIVGLGNPGKEYEVSRHNVGFMVVDRLAEVMGISFRKKNKYAAIAETIIESRPTLLVKPVTFMNRSGLAVSELQRYSTLALERSLVVLDDANLPFGRLRMRGQGSSGGHKGLASIIDQLGTEEIARLRLGIGSPGDSAEMINFVLSKFSKKEKKQLDATIEVAAEAVQSFIVNGLERTMNRYNAYE